MNKYIQHITTNPLIKNYLKVFTVDVFVKATGIILLPVYLKLMTQEEFGVYGYLVTIISTFSLVFNLGIYTAQSKLYHDYPKDEDRGRVLFTLNVILVVFITILFGFILKWDLDYRVVDFLFKTSFDYSPYRGPVLLGIIVSVYSLMLINFFLTSEDIGKVQMYNLSRIVFVNAIVMVILFFSKDSDNAMLRLKYSYGIEFVLIVAFFTFYFKKMRLQFDQRIAVKAIRISMPILLSAILGLFINLADRYFIEKYGTLKDLSVYNLAIAISGVVPFIFASFQNIWLPHFLKEKDVESNRVKSRKMIMRLLAVFIFLSVLILVSLQLMLFTDIIGREYESIMPLLPIVLITSIVSSLTPMYSNHLIYLNKLHLIVFVGVPIAILGILLNLLLVPLYGIYGAATSTLVTSAVYLAAYAVLVNYFYRQYRIENKLDGLRMSDRQR